MYRKIVAGYGTVEQGDEVLRLACTLAEPAGASVVATTVVDARNRALGPVLFEDLERRAKRTIESTAARLPFHAEVTPRVTSGWSAGSCLDELASAEAADLLVVGSTHRGRLGRVLLGTTAEGLLHGGGRPVAIAPRGYERPLGGIRTIAVGHDRTAHSRGALEWAVDAVMLLDATLRVITVTGSPRPDAEPLIQEALRRLPPNIPRSVEVRGGDPATELRAAVEEGVDLLVVGSRGHRALRSLIGGSVSSPLAQDCPVPLVVVPRAAGAALDAAAVPLAAAYGAVSL